MKESNTNNHPYLPLLSMVIGWNLLSYLTGMFWIGYLALAIGFAGIVSEKIAVKTIQIIHGVFKFIFNIVQKVMLSIVYFLVFSPIALLKKKNLTSENHWIIPKSTLGSDLKKPW